MIGEGTFRDKFSYRLVDDDHDELALKEWNVFVKESKSIMIRTFLVLFLHWYLFVDSGV